MVTDAGHYVPNVAHRVWVGNGKSEGAHINLHGMSVGNGLTDPEVQYAYYPQMAVSTNQHQPAVSNATFAKMQKAVPGCVNAIKKCNGGSGPVAKLSCMFAYETCNAALMEPYQMTGMNPCELPPQRDAGQQKASIPVAQPRATAVHAGWRLRGRSRADCVRRARRAGCTQMTCVSSVRSRRSATTSVASASSSNAPTFGRRSTFGRTRARGRAVTSRCVRRHASFWKGGWMAWPNNALLQ